MIISIFKNFKFKHSLYTAILLCMALGNNAYSFEKEMYLTSTNKQAEVLKGTIVVKFRKSTVSSANTAEPVNGLDVNKVVLPPGKTVTEAVKEFSSREDVIYAEPVYIKRAFILPAEYTDDVELNKKQWGLEKISAPDGWAIETGKNVVIAVLDTGIDIDHPDLSNNMWINPDPSSEYCTYNDDGIKNYEIQYDTHGWDFVNDDNCPDDDDASLTGGHGTHCAGIIAAQANNLPSSIVGVSWHNKLMAVKVLDCNGYGTSIDVARGIYYAADRGAKVINMSYGGEKSTIEKEALDYAFDKGCILVAASGNDGNPEVSYPASHKNVIAVGASDFVDNRAEFSNYGNDLDLLAPGINIYSTNIGGYCNLSGTSMACPFVSGLASLIISYWDNGDNPNWTPNQVKDALISNCDRTSYTLSSNRDNQSGYGRINVKKTMEFVSNSAVNTSEDKILVYPNPFNPDINQQSLIVLPENSQAEAEELKIYSLEGQEVRKVDVSGKMAHWDGKNNDGDVCATGLYFYYLDTTKGSEKGKITLLR
ncbi:S8 family serine peptidase [Elusimicrobiota bacterium]